MFCPVCKGEFRPEFRRCGACEVDLVEDLSTVHRVSSEAPSAEGLGDFDPADLCGFLTLDEARNARDTLRAQRIRSEIAIRESPDSRLGEPIKEEFWLRVERRYFRAAAERLGCQLTVDDEQADSDDSGDDPEEDDPRFQD